MEITINREQLVKGLQLLDPIVSSHTASTITPDVLISTEGKDKCILIGSDIETWLRVEVPCKVISPGEICIPAKKLYNAVKELDENDMMIKTQDDKTPIAQMFCGKTKNTFIGQPAKNHPGMPKYDEKQAKSQEVRIKSEVLLDALIKTTFATSKEETRYYLNGVYFNIQKDTAKFVATDGRRLAYVTRNINPTKTVVSGIVPTKAADRVINIIEKSSAEECTFSLLAEHFVFSIDNISFVSRLIQGDFPAYEQVIPKISTTLKAKVEKLAKGIKQSLWVIGEKGFGIKFLFTKNGLKLSSIVESIGISEVEVEIEYVGKDVEVKFEPSYILEFLSVIDSKENVIVGVNEPTSPWTMQPENDKNYIYILMPMKL
ncbi:MAG: DNA polymerase III subunit beta [Endomicrobia bacterium]|nr:DNA polymerase III subunit beta [Endomicrobiia bacterium]